MSAPALLAQGSLSASKQWGGPQVPCRACRAQCRLQHTAQFRQQCRARPGNLRLRAQVRL